MIRITGKMPRTADQAAGIRQIWMPHATQHSLPSGSATVTQVCATTMLEHYRGKLALLDATVALPVVAATPPLASGLRALLSRFASSGR